MMYQYTKCFNLTVVEVNITKENNRDFFLSFPLVDGNQLLELFEELIQVEIIF